MPAPLKNPRPAARPLSPHLGIYRWQISNTLSILHRMTGFALAIGLLVLVPWLWGVAYNPSWFDKFQQLLVSIPGQLLLFGWTVAFYYHLGNGIRHLFWDTGRGFSIPHMTESGLLVLAFTFCATTYTWLSILGKTGAL